MVTMNWLDDWSAATDYAVGDVVRYDGDLWVASENPGVGEVPGEDIIIPGAPGGSPAPVFDTLPSQWMTYRPTSDPLFVPVLTTSSHHSPTYIGGNGAEAVAFQTDASIPGSTFFNLRQNNLDGGNAFWYMASGGSAGSLTYGGSGSKPSGTAWQSVILMEPNVLYFVGLSCRGAADVTWELCMEPGANGHIVPQGSGEPGEDTIVPSHWELLSTSTSGGGIVVPTVGQLWPRGT